jgi:hypothetical protein
MMRLDWRIAELGHRTPAEKIVGAQPQSRDRVESQLHTARLKSLTMVTSNPSIIQSKVSEEWSLPKPRRLNLAIARFDFEDRPIAV